MKKVFGILVLLLAVGMPALAQSQRMSGDDQDKFNGYYSHWLEYKQTNNRDDMISMEQHMQDLMAKYSVPSNTPYEVVASQSGDPRPERYSDRDRAYGNPWQGRMSADDQHEFNKQYEKWQEATAKNHRGDIEDHARKMEALMTRYNIPANTPFDVVATSGGYSPRYERREFQGRLSADDQKKFDKEYEEWLEKRRKNDRDDIAKHEGKMQEIMARYNIPRDVPYDDIASGGRRY